MSETTFRHKIKEAIKDDNDILLAEAIRDYFKGGEDFILWKDLKSFFIAARSEDSDTWKNLSQKHAEATRNVLNWTKHSPNTISVILRTYERATPELKRARETGRISRYPAESISRLHKGTLKDLQPRVIDVFLKYGMTNEMLRSLVQDLQRTLTTEEQEKVLEDYIEKTTVVFSGTYIAGQKTLSSEDQNSVHIYVPAEMNLSDIEKLSEDELRELEKMTELFMSNATSLLRTTLKHIREELLKKLMKKIEEDE